MAAVDLEQRARETDWGAQGHVVVGLHLTEKNPTNVGVNSIDRSGGTCRQQDDVGTRLYPKARGEAGTHYNSVRVFARQPLPLGHVQHAADQLFLFCVHTLAGE
jgi:hypothetical protein